jgi:hypothetical protein
VPAFICAFHKNSCTSSPDKTGLPSTEKAGRSFEKEGQPSAAHPTSLRYSVAGEKPRFL